MSAPLTHGGLVCSDGPLAILLSGEDARRQDHP
jgi:hypothetical protein